MASMLKVAKRPSQSRNRQYDGDAFKPRTKKATGNTKNASRKVSTYSYGKVATKNKPKTSPKNPAQQEENRKIPLLFCVMH